MPGFSFVQALLSVRITISERNWISFVLKKIFKAVTAFTLLVGCYLGYVQVFGSWCAMTTTRHPKR